MKYFKTPYTFFIFLSFFTCSSLFCLSQSNDSNEEQLNPSFVQQTSDADRLIIEHKYEKALTILDSLSIISPENLILKERSGLCYYRLGMLSRAKDVYKEILKTDTAHSVALNQLGQICIKEGNLMESIQYYNRLTRIDSTNSYYFKQLGQIQSKAGSILGAISMYSKTLTLNPRDIEVYASLAELLIETEIMEIADSIIGMGLQVDSTNYNLKMLQAKSAFQQNRFEEVTEVIEGILHEKDTIPIFANLLGSSYYRLKEYKKVIPCMQLLLKSDYDQDWIYFYLGIAYRETGNEELSTHHLKLAVQKGISKNIDSYYTQLGISYDKANDYSNAILLRKLMSMNKTNSCCIE
ncbi:MAG TPA: tetratricopeptide repeat protein [Cytophagales bacterium]|nr:tetratricopeptide repeat protein [Cytophagales bacterium]